MAFTYDPTTSRGRVRLLVRDTVEADAIFTDAEVDALLSLSGSDVWLAAASAYRALAGDAARVAVAYQILGELNIDRKTIADKMNAIADKLETRAGTEPGFHLQEVGWLFNAAGIDESPKDEANADQDAYYDLNYKSVGRI